jgi:CheY-like chemotaxis protein
VLPYIAKLSQCVYTLIVNELIQDPTSLQNETLLEKTVPRVLLVDDEPSSLSSAKAAFAGTGYQIITCRSAIEALSILNSQKIDCVITDIVMPVMDGYELVRAIRTTSPTPNVPILMLTRRRLREDVQAAVQAGANDYILKPIDEQVFLDKVEANIKKSSAKRYLFEHALHGDSIPAELKVAARIIAISEADITLGLPSAVNSSSSSELTTRLFNDIGIVAPVLQLLYCQKVAEGARIMPELHYEARYSFMGIPEIDSRKIRAWLHRQALERRK